MGATVRRFAWRIGSLAFSASSNFKPRTPSSGDWLVNARRAERERQWQLAIDTAKGRFIDDHRSEILNRRVHHWQQADAIRAYCDAVEARYGGDVIADDEAAQWLKLARNYANRLQTLPRMPAAPQIRPEELKPYLGPWSPYGPSRQGW